jgi:hypothetical protein
VRGDFAHVVFSIFPAFLQEARRTAGEQGGQAEVHGMEEENE